MANILVVDDDDIMVTILSEVLQEQGHTIRTARDGQSGLDEALRQTPDLIILDMIMPVMSGYKVARELRALPQTREIPILAVTCQSHLEGYEAAYDVGCSAFLAKPIQAAVLVRRVNELLNLASQPL